jgi:large subunit ribosomal protein L15
MQLHNLQPNQKNKTKKRVGRGGKRGGYSGRGQKGQKARAGRKLPKSELHTIKSIPKLRGSKNITPSEKPTAINLDKLEALEEKTINKKILAKKGIIKNTKAPAKILGDGEIKNALTIEGIPLSKQAKEKIESAGGTIK